MLNSVQYNQNSVTALQLNIVFIPKITRNFDMDWILRFVFMHFVFQFFFILVRSVISKYQCDWCLEKFVSRM